MFELSPNIDKNKIFLVNLSELQNRYDPIFYSFKLNIDSFIKVKKIGKVQGGKRLPKGYYYSEFETEYIYLRVSDLSSDNNIDWNNIKYISKEVFEILKRYQVFEGDLVFSIAGTVGKTKIIKNIPNGKKVILTENAAKIKIKDDNYLPETLEIIFKSKILQKQIDLNYIQTTIPKIGLDRIENLYIPYFDLPTQQQIIDLYENAYKAKQQKEAEAERLLNSIDDYLFGELGIELPEKDNSLENRIFKVNFSKITGRRFDPIYYSNGTNFLFKSIYEYKRLKEYSFGFISGFGIGRNEQARNGNGIIQIRPTNIDANGDLKFDKNIYVPNDIAKKYYLLQHEDILFNNTNSQELVGKTAIFLSEINKAVCSNHITVIKVFNSKLNPYYLKELMNVYQRKGLFYSICTNWNNQSGVGNELLKNLQIPIPPIEKQNEIAEHIKAIREQAKQLKTEAKEVLEQAKQEVEKMILGKL